MKIIGDQAKPLKVNPVVSEQAAADLEAARNKRAEERERREKRLRLQRRRAWQLTAVTAAILTVLLPLFSVIYWKMGGRMIGLRILVTLVILITPVSEWWRRHFQLTHGQMAAATGGGAFIAASLNVLYLWVR